LPLKDAAALRTRGSGPRVYLPSDSSCLPLEGSANRLSSKGSVV